MFVLSESANLKFKFFNIKEFKCFAKHCLFLQLYNPSNTIEAKNTFVNISVKSFWNNKKTLFNWMLIHKTLSSLITWWKPDLGAWAKSVLCVCVCARLCVHSCAHVPVEKGKLLVIFVVEKYPPSLRVLIESARAFWIKDWKSDLVFSHSLENCAF